MDKKRKHRPMNDLQALIANYIDDHPGENYSSIARRGGMSRSTVYSAARAEKRKQGLQEHTIVGLAKGMEMAESIVRVAAGSAAGYDITVPQEMDTDEGRLIVAAYHQLDEGRKKELARRARFLLAEAQEASGDGDQ